MLATAIRLAEERGCAARALHVITVPLELPIAAEMADEAAAAARHHMEGEDVVVIDQSEEALGRLGHQWSGEFHLGHGMDTSVLEKAGIAEADAFVASTDGDNTNIVIAQVAKRRYEVPTV